MSDPATQGVLLTLDAAKRTKKAVRWFERNGGATRKRKHRGDVNMPPIRGILLEDLVNGGTADCAVTTLDETTWIQTVTIIGDVAGGTFKLAFTPGQGTGPSTDSLPFNCTPQAMQSALENLSTIGKGNVVVRMGKQTYHNDAANTDTSESPGVWIVEFVGTFAQSKTAPPLLTATNALGSAGSGPPQGDGLNAAIVIESTEHWVDTGAVDAAKAIIPVGVPTPMRTGAVIVCIFFPGVGYGVIACEPREFSQTYY